MLHLAVRVAVVAAEEHDHEVIVNSSGAPDQNRSRVTAVISLALITSCPRNDSAKILPSTSRSAVEDELIRMSGLQEEGGKKK